MATTTKEQKAQAKRLSEIEAYASMGSDEFYRHPLCGAFIYTSNFKLFADAAGAHWLLDIPASVIATKPALRRAAFQLWEVKVDEETRSAVVTCREDSDQPVIYTQEIEYTDFPRESFKFYVCNNGRGFTAMLRQEY